MSQKTGPIRSEELLNQQAWVELLKSYRVADAVVRKLVLYVKPADQADSLAFEDFAIGDRFVPGTYELDVDRAQKRWRLALETGAVADSGGAADSLGVKVGFRWVLPTAVFVGSGERKIRFTVATPRETAIEYINRLQTSLQENGSFLSLTLRDQNPHLAARTMNTWLNEYVSVAAQLKKRNVVEYASILGGQLKYAETSLRDAESALESFRVHTITLPTEAAPVAAGVQETRDPAIKNFFDQRFELDALRHDRETLAGEACHVRQRFSRGKEVGHRVHPQHACTPDRCIVQLGPVALTLGWLRSTPDSVAEGRLLVIVWQGTVTPRRRFHAERPAGQQLQAKSATVLWECEFAAEAASEATSTARPTFVRAACLSRSSAWLCWLLLK